jgi:CelD/BcsL family acetyltransferase involved in cellulose biosynthesis
MGLSSKSHLVDSLANVTDVFGRGASAISGTAGTAGCDMSLEVRQRGAAVGTVVQVDPTSDSRWDAFVASRRDASIFHHSAWLKTLEAEYGRCVLGLACEGSGGELLGVLPLLQTRGLPLRGKDRLSGRRLSSLPRTPTAGPLAVDQAASKALVRSAVDRVAAEPALQLQLKVEAPHLDGLVEGLEGERWRQTFVLELPRPPAELRFGNARNHARIRWAVKKAERLNVHVRHAETEGDLRGWYRLYLETMRSHAAPPRPYRLFSAMWTMLRPEGLMDVLLAERDRRLLAGSIFLTFGETVFYAFNGCHRNALGLRPNDIIMWSAIHEASGAGYRRFDLGEVDSTATTLADFKRKWGTQASWLYRYYYPARGAKGSMPDGAVLTAAKTLWRHLPLQGTAILGDWIYSCL